MTVQRVLRGLAAFTFGYELGALNSRGHLPTISVLCGPRRWLRPLVVGALALHLYQKELYAILGKVRR